MYTLRVRGLLCLGTYYPHSGIIIITRFIINFITISFVLLIEIYTHVPVSCKHVLASCKYL